MAFRNSEGYADRYTSDAGQGLSVVEYNRPGGFVITTTKLDNNTILTKVRFNTAGVADSDVQVFGKKSNSIISVVISGEDSHIMSESEQANLDKAEFGEALLRSNPNIIHQAIREQHIQRWFNEGVYGRLEFIVPSNCTSSFEASVVNGILTVYIICAEVERTTDEQWVDMVNSRQIRQAGQAKKNLSQANKDQRRVQSPLYDLYVKKYRL